MDIDTSKIDFDRAAMLLGLIEKQAAVSPKATHLGAAAHSEIMKLNDAIKVASIKAEKERREQEAIDAHQVIDPDGDPTASDPNKDVEHKITPEVYPVGSNTATIADANIPRRV